MTAYTTLYLRTRCSSSSTKQQLTLVCGPIRDWFQRQMMACAWRSHTVHRVSGPIVADQKDKSRNYKIFSGELVVGSSCSWHCNRRFFFPSWTTQWSTGPAEGQVPASTAAQNASLYSWTIDLESDKSLRHTARIRVVLSSIKFHATCVREHDTRCPQGAERRSPSDQRDRIPCEVATTRLLR